jgi:ribosomal subunit interface protein
MEHSDSIEQYVNKQLEKIEQFLENEPTPIFIDFVLEPSKSRAHPRVELLIKTPHYDRIVHEEQDGTDMYEVIDTIVERMYRLLHEDKQKVIDERRRHVKWEKVPENVVEALDPEDTDDWDDLGKPE